MQLGRAKIALNLGSGENVPPLESFVIFGGNPRFKYI
jgi:hypothetical protein